MSDYVLEDARGRRVVFSGEGEVTEDIANAAFASAYPEVATMSAAPPLDPVSAFVGGLRGEIKELEDKGFLAKASLATLSGAPRIGLKALQEGIRAIPGYTANSWKGSVLRAIAPEPSLRQEPSIFEPSDDSFAVPKPEDLSPIVAEGFAVAAGPVLQAVAAKAGMSRDRLGRAIYAPIAGLQRFAVSPGGMLTGMSMGVLGAAGLEPASSSAAEATRSIVSGAFSLDLANAAQQEAALAEESLRSGDRAAALEHAIGAVASSAFAFGAAKHAVASQARLADDSGRLASMLAEELEEAGAPATARAVLQTATPIVERAKTMPMRLSTEPRELTLAPTMRDIGVAEESQVVTEEARQPPERAGIESQASREGVIPSATEERIEPTDIPVQPAEAVEGGLPEEAGARNQPSEEAPTGPTPDVIPPGPESSLASPPQRALSEPEPWSLAAPESPSELAAREFLESAAREQRAKDAAIREALATQAAEPLPGGPADARQGALFDEPEALSSIPSAEPAAVAAKPTELATPSAASAAPVARQPPRLVPPVIEERPQGDIAVPLRPVAAPQPTTASSLPPVIGIRRESIAEQRRARGEAQADIPPLPEQSPQARIDVAVERLKHEPLVADQLVAELLKKPRALDSDEVALLRVRQVDIDREYSDALKAGEAAAAAGDAEGKLNATKRLDFLLEKLRDLEMASRAAGSFWHQTGIAMQEGLRQDYTLAGLLRKASAAKGFLPLSEAERAEVAELHKQLTKATDDLRAKETLLAQTEADLAIERTRSKALPYDKRVLDYAAKLVAELNVTADRYSKELFGAAWAPTPEMWAKAVFIGAARMARGVVDLAQWTDDMVRTLGTETFRPYADQVWAASRQFLDDRFTQDAAHPASRKGANAAKAKLSVQEQLAAAEADMRSVTEFSVQDFHLPVQRFLRALVTLDPKITREAVIDRVHALIQEVLPTATRLMAMDAISGRGIFKLPSQETIAKTVRDLKTQIRLLGHQEDVLAGRPLPRTGMQRDPMSAAAIRENQRLNDLLRQFGIRITDPEAQLRSWLQARETYLRRRIEQLRHEISTKQKRISTPTSAPFSPEIDALRKELAAVTAEHEAVFGKPQPTLDQQIKAALAEAERSLKDWEGKLRDAEQGIFTKATPAKPRPTTAEIEAVRAQVQEKRARVAALRKAAKPEPSPAIALAMAKLKAEAKLARLRDQMAREDFSARPRRERVKDEALLILEGKIEEAQEKADAMAERLRFEAMSPFQKALRLSANAYDSARLMMTTGEASFALRQGKSFVLTRPYTAAKVLATSTRAFLSEDLARAAELRIRQAAEYPASQRAKLYIAREGDPLTRQEEFFMGRWVRAIGFTVRGKTIRPAHAFSRAGVTFLNQVRWEYWLSMRKMLSRFGEPTAIEDAMYARYANEATGRGGLGALEKDALALGRIAFAPRYVASRMQYAAGHALWQGTLRSRAIITSEYARTLVGWVLYNNLLLLGLQLLRDDDEKPVSQTFDWRASDFAKHIVGRVRLDTLAGFAQLATFAGRSATGEMKRPGGQVVPIRGQDVPYGGSTWWSVFGRFLGSKAHPVPLAIGSLFAGVDLFGNDTSLTQEMAKLGGPMTYSEIYAALRAEGLDEGAALGVLSFFGEGLQTYKKRHGK